MTRRIAVFAFDLAEAAQRRTIQAIAATGAEVETFSMRRRNMAARPTAIPDTPLGITENGRLLRRCGTLGGALRRLWQARHRLARADLIVARNLDMALLAWAGSAMTGRRIPIVYQCLDIHGLMTTRGAVPATLRWVERRLLARGCRLVVSAPAFLEAYFAARQGYEGPSLVMENRVVLADRRLPRPTAAPAGAGPLRIGWVGTLRCPGTLHLLAETAAALGDRVQIILRGVVHRAALPDFDRILADHANLHFEGPYTYPDGLGEAYDGLDVVWAQDLWQQGGNSDWLLPNRLYEAGWCGCPVLAVAGTATGRRVAQLGSGVVLSDASADALIRWLSGPAPSRLPEIRAALHRMPAECFLSPLSETQAMIAPPDPKTEPALAPA